MRIIGIRITYKLLKKDNKLTARLSAEHWNYIQYLMAKHEDFNISNIIRELLDSCIKLDLEGFDLLDKKTVRKIIINNKKST